MKIPAIQFSNKHYITAKQNKEQEKTSPYTDKPTELHSLYNDHLLAFGNRVDKDLNRFYSVNKDRMPITVRNLVEPMQNRNLITPLEAQYYAFKNLEEAETIEDIKTKYYPKEPLFEELKDLSEIKPSKGFLQAAKEMEEIYPDGVLQSKENLTVYLVKKIFLEAKTLDEINKDLDEDLIPDFKKYCKGIKTKDNLVLGSTLSALGIKMPDSNYLTSLRFTRDGYSDVMGAKISKGLKAFLRTLTPEQLTARAIRSTREFEKWWNSLTRKEKIEMIANKEAEIDMLKAFKKEKRAEKKRLKEAGVEISNTNETEDKTVKRHTKVGSKELSQDELFKKWATLNIKTFEAGLSQAEMDTLHLKRSANLFIRWKEMSPAERTEYISNMKAGSEPVRYTMIDAWNNSPEIIKALYLHLKNNQVYKPADLLYSTQEFSQFQSKVMSEFWDNNPDFAELLGDRIHQSHNKVEWSIQQGNFEELKNQINRNKNQRKRELEEYKKSLERPKVEEKPADPTDYKTDFRNAYFNNKVGMVSSVPKNYFNDMYGAFLEILPEDSIKIWIKNLRGEQLNLDEATKLHDALENVPLDLHRISLAFEAAMADTIYNVTGNPQAFELSTSDVKTVMYHIERGESPIKIVSFKNGNKEYNFEIKNKKSINPARINQLYESFKRELSEDEILDIVRYNFRFEVDDNDDLETKKQKVSEIQSSLLIYLKIFGRSANILFSDKSAYPPAVKLAFANKFYSGMPPKIKNSNILRTTQETKGDIEADVNIQHAKTLYTHRFAFLPKELINSYFKELTPLLKILTKEDNEFSLPNALGKLCRKRTALSDHGSLLPMPKHMIKDKYIKYQMLAIEQAMADTLYDATGDENVYKIGFEFLCDKLELFSLAKNFPLEKSECPSVDGGNVDLVVKKRINLGDVQKRYKEYMNEISEWVDETKDVQKPNLQDLLYILNPEEENTARDFNVAERIATYFPDFSELDFKSNPYGPDIKLINKNQQ
ncbi:MAG: hypothetical protein NC191_03315 [Muribaculaceae bacterium]|nr:hypothetical protein [Muribaculaceae bacterium]